MPNFSPSVYGYFDDTLCFATLNLNTPQRVNKINTSDQEIQRFAIVLIIGIFAIGFVFGYVLAWARTEVVLEHKHWQELVRRGYAIEVESSAGKGYKWREDK